MEVPRSRSRVHKNVRRALGGDDAMVMATKARMTTETDEGESITESAERLREKELSHIRNERA